MQAIDLNADMGEYTDDNQRSAEAELMLLVSSCSIACGGHAGDDETMVHTVRLAKKRNVSIGAHPSYPDREGFGRRSLKFDATELLESLKDQIAALKKITDDEGASLNHVKPHGALYNDAAKDLPLAELIVEAAGGAIIVGPPGSKIEDAAKIAGKNFSAEGFVDRLYLQSGALTPRGTPGAVIEDVAARAEQARAIAKGETFRASGGALTLTVQTLCIHSDSPGAAETARAVRAALESDGFTIRTFA
jgi:UPF0271 protein